MKNKNFHIERRQHPKFNVKDGVVALLFDKRLRIGKIMDISLGGLGFTYIGDAPDDLTNQTVQIHLLNNNHICIEGISCRVVADTLLENNFSPDGRSLKRCGLKFGGLTRTQQRLLKDAIDASASLEAIKRDLLEKKLAESEEKYQTILENIEEGYFEVDLSGNVTFFNNSMIKLGGYTAEEAIGTNYRDITDANTAETIFRIYNKAYRTGILPPPFDWEFLKKNGEKIHLATSLTFIKDTEGKVTGFRGVARDISQQKSLEQRLLHMASHDPLTTLYNRTAFFERLRETIARSRRLDQQCALFFLDLDNFKIVNDKYGHDAGDAVLKEVATRLTSLLRETDVISRHGGDEFTIIVSNPDTTELDVVARKIIEALADPYHVAGQKIDCITTSIGISIYPDDGSDAGEMVNRADKAMYQAKKKKNRYLFYNAAPNAAKPAARLTEHSDVT